MLGGLHTLYVSGCNNITDESVKMLGELHTLNLTDCQNITDAGIISLVKRNNESVEERDSGNNAPNVEDSRRNESVKMLGGLHTLYVSGCKNITDASIKFLIKRNNESVEERDSGNNALNVEDSRRNDSAKRLEGLHTLYLTGCTNITNKSVILLTKLHTLYLSHCKNITNECILYLQQNGV